jgi:small conductance mechanosensitive channel
MDSVVMVSAVMMSAVGAQLAPSDDSTEAMSWLTDFIEANHALVTTPLLIVGVFVVTWFTTRLSRLVVHGVVSRLSRRGLAAASGVGRAPKLWRTRARRTSAAETFETSERRRNQRVDAAATMVNHLISVVIWLIAMIALFNILDLDAAYFLTSAGFLGAALAFGGQHKVNDYLTGLSVLFEDRYGVGDLVEFTAASGATIEAVVDHIGLFSTRLRDAESTLHMPNAALAQVRNISQEPAAAVIRVRSSGQEPERVIDTVKGLAGTSDLTRVVFLGDLVSQQPSTGEIEIGVHTLKPLDQQALETLARRAEEALSSSTGQAPTAVRLGDDEDPDRPVAP